MTVGPGSSAEGGLSRGATDTEYNSDGGDTARGETGGSAEEEASGIEAKTVYSTPIIQRGRPIGGISRRRARSSDTPWHASSRSRRPAIAIQVPERRPGDKWGWEEWCGEATGAESTESSTADTTENDHRRSPRKCRREGQVMARVVKAPASSRDVRPSRQPQTLVGRQGDRDCREYWRTSFPRRWRLGGRTSQTRLGRIPSVTRAGGGRAVGPIGFGESSPSQ